jgi:hypothetical protein
MKQTRKKRARSKRGPNKQRRSPDTLYGSSVAVATNFSSRSRATTITVKETERIGTIQGSQGFDVNKSYYCNPGVIDSFPWLSAQANLFEEYRFTKLTYRYKNLKGSATDGNILLSFDYDSLDSPPANALDVTQSTLYKDGAPWRIFEMNVPCNRGWLYTRRSDIPQGGDLKTYDMGQLFVSTEACEDFSDHGYLEVSYTVQFRKKQPTVVRPVVSSPGIAAAGTFSVSSQSYFVANTYLQLGDTNANQYQYNSNEAVFKPGFGAESFDLVSGYYQVTTNCLVTNSNPFQGFPTLLQWRVNLAALEPSWFDPLMTVSQTDHDGEAISDTRVVFIPNGLEDNRGLLSLFCVSTDVTDFQYPIHLRVNLIRIADAPVVPTQAVAKESVSSLLQKLKLSKNSVEPEEKKDDGAPPDMSVKSMPVDIPRPRLKRARSGRRTPTSSPSDDVSMDYEMT